MSLMPGIMAYEIHRPETVISSVDLLVTSDRCQLPAAGTGTVPVPNQQYLGRFLYYVDDPYCIRYVVIVPAASCMIPGWPMYGSGLVLDSKWYQMPYQVPCKYDLSAVESTSTNANYRILFWYQVVHVTTTWFDTRRSNAAVSFF